MLLAVYNVPHHSALKKKKKKNVKIRCLCDLKVRTNFAGRTVAKSEQKRTGKREREKEKERKERKKGKDRKGHKVTLFSRQTKRKCQIQG